jgi:hypothetical protein
MPYHKDHKLFRCKQLQHLVGLDGLGDDVLGLGVGCGEFVVLVSVIFPLASFTSLLFS